MAAVKLTKKNPLTLVEFDEFKDVKLVEKHGRYHAKKKKNGKTTWYSAAYIDPAHVGKICGRVTSPDKGSAQFQVFRGRTKPQYLITPEAGCTMSAAMLEERVMEAVKEIYNKTYTVFPKDTGINKDNWDGFYQRLSRAKDKTLSTSGRADLDYALRLGEISKDYHAMCIAVGIEMEHH